MSRINFVNVSFQYKNSPNEVFSGVNLTIDSSWKTGLVGNNGRGKTTLLGLIHGMLEPTRGNVETPGRTRLFPYSPIDGQQLTRAVIKGSIAPYQEWEAQMDALLEEPSEQNLTLYGELLERYQSFDGYGIDARIEKEMAGIGLASELLERPFRTLSGGEQTRAMIVALFVRSGELPLIDEPTNHLDMAGREELADYLNQKSGFVLVSHDRDFLDRCVDHIVSINRADIRVNHGSYSEWRYQMELEEESERRRNANLKQQIRQLELAAGQRRTWSGRKEKQKKGAYDKGRIGKLAARVMKRALAIEGRADEKLEEKRNLLKNVDKHYTLRLESSTDAPTILLQLENIVLEVGGRTLLEDFSLDVRQGERIAVIGPNGCGKSSLFNAICGDLPIAAGNLYRSGHLQLMRAFQTPLWNSGLLRERLLTEGLDETFFRQILGVLGVSGDIFERPLETFSQGQLKKVDLCRSFVSPAHLLLWDEPLNYVDLRAREQLEEVILEHQPTLLFIEHDRRFVEEVATDVVELG